MKALVALTLSLFATQAQAQALMCTSSQSIYEMLEKDWGEERLLYGLDVGGVALEIFVNPDTRTFTLLSTDANGLSCIQAQGDSFDLYKFSPNV